MVQHKIRQKVSLPKGVKQKSLKSNNVPKQRGPRKGANLSIAPKKKAAVQDAKIGAEVTRIINDKNEDVTRARADHDVGKITKKPQK